MQHQKSIIPATVDTIAALCVISMLAAIINPHRSCEPFCHNINMPEQETNRISEEDRSSSTEVPLHINCVGIV